MHRGSLLQTHCREAISHPEAPHPGSQHLSPAENEPVPTIESSQDRTTTKHLQEGLVDSVTAHFPDSQSYPRNSEVQVTLTYLCSAGLLDLKIQGQ